MFKTRGFRWGLLLIAALVVGYAGIRFGRMLSERKAAETAHEIPFPFRPGDRFPSVVLADSLGVAVASDSLVAGHGAVVLLLDPTCEGCTDMSIRWEHIMADGFFDPSRVFGISRATGDANRAYRAANHLSFPIYRDTEDAFLRLHGVTSYPLEIVVGQSGTIQALSDDSVSPVDADEIRRLMAQ